jgi:hypothetical protein
LTKLDISKNGLRVAGAKVLAESLRGNQIMTDINIASNILSDCGEDMSGIAVLADVIPSMRAILSVNLLKNMIGVDQAKALASILKEHPTLKSLCGNSGEETELDMSGKGMDAGDVIMLVPEIVDNGTISSVNLLKNDISVAQAEDLVSILKEHPTFKSLCGNKGNETALDMSGKMTGAADAVMLTAEIIDNRAISQFTFSGDRKHSKPVTIETSMTEADFSGKDLALSGTIMLSAFLPKCT